MKSYKKILFAFLFIILDFIIYIVLGLIILNYEDFYDESKGEYWSLESMSTLEKVGYIGWYVWLIFNILLATYLIFKLIKWLKLKK